MAVERTELFRRILSGQFAGHRKQPLAIASGQDDSPSIAIVRGKPIPLVLRERHLHKPLDERRPAKYSLKWAVRNGRIGLLQHNVSGIEIRNGSQSGGHGVSKFRKAHDYDGFQDLLVSEAKFAKRPDVMIENSCRFAVELRSEVQQSLHLKRKGRRSKVDSNLFRLWPFDP